MKNATDRERDKQFGIARLDECDLDSDPVRQFGVWYKNAQEAEHIHPNAFTLASTSESGQPAARMLLLKDFDDRGFVFYTNIESRKGEELKANPKAAMCFWWDKLERQVRIEGSIEEVSSDEADEYFASRPLGSKLGAWASPQSSVISGREELEQRYAELESKFGQGKIPRPPYWTGFRLIPDSIEFWQGRPNRLHDRIRYRFITDGKWLMERLAP